MLDNMFSSIIKSSVNAGSFAICTVSSIVLGALIAFFYMKGEHHTKSFVVTLAMIPAIVQVVIMMVNGNIGAGVAVAGTFSLVRFRSATGTAKEIGSIFLAMAVGLATGMGYVGVAFVFAVVMIIISSIYSATSFGETKSEEKELKIVIPENIDYNGVFDDILNEYTKSFKLVKAKTSNMGSLYKLTYNVVLSDNSREKEMMDALRTKNGNLEISCGQMLTYESDL